MKDWCIYDLAWGPLKYPLALLFLIDFRLFWPSTRAALRGDTATNISSGLARFSGFIGKVVHALKWG